MHLLKSVSVLVVMFMVTTVLSADSWTYDPDIYRVKIKNDRISFTEKRGNREDGPELYAEDTNIEFYTLVRNLINKASRSKTPVVFYYEKYKSANNGTYNKIIPQN